MRVVFTGRRRTPWRLAVGNFFSFGIRRRFWLVKVNRELDGHATLELNHGLHIFLVCLPILGPLFLSFDTYARIRELTKGADIQTNRGLGFIVLLPLLGPSIQMAYAQARLNQYWEMVRDDEKLGIEIGLSKQTSKKFYVELEEAKIESRKPGSRFDEKKKARRERFEKLRSRYDEIQTQRARVRNAGGSTPVRPWKAPVPIEPRKLEITCGDCELQFTRLQDAYEDTPILCPRCGLKEVLPGFASNPFREDVQVGAIPSLEVNCPDCGTTFHAQRYFDAPTPIECYQCGKQDVLDLPKVKA